MKCLTARRAPSAGAQKKSMRQTIYPGQSANASRPEVSQLNASQASMKQSLLWMAPWVCLSHMATIASACEVIALTSPVLGAQIADGQPELTWDRKEPGHYRVQIAVSLPEARVISSTDVITADNRFKFPVPMAASLASVKVLVSQGCPDLDAQDLNARGPAFFINTRGACSLPDSGLQQSGPQLRWDPVARAERYRVRLFEVKPDQHGVTQTNWISTTETEQPAWPIPTGTDTPPPQSETRTRARVATVQAICSGLTGPVQASRLRDAP